MAFDGNHSNFTKGIGIYNADGSVLYWQVGDTGAMQFGNTTTTGLIIGAGTTSARYAMGTTANQNMIGVFAETTATTGDSRVINSRLYFSGVGGSGEVGRFYGIVNNVTAATGGTVNGVHATLQVNGASGAISGAANAIRATFAQGANNVAGGTCAVMQLDSDLDNAATVATSLSYIRFTNTNTKKVGTLFNFDSSIDTTTLYVNSGTSSGSAGDTDNCNAPKVLRCLVNGSAVYIPVFTQNS